MFLDFGGVFIGQRLDFFFGTLQVIVRDYFILIGFF